MDNKHNDFYNNSSVYIDRMVAHNKEYFSEYLKFVSYYFKNSEVKILDIGCGPGHSTYLLSNKFTNVIGLDISEKFIQHAKKTYNSINFHESSAENLPYLDNEFDAVMCYNTVEHFIDVEKALKEMLRVTKKGGCVIINSPNLLSIRHPLNAITKEKGESFEGKKSIISNLYIFFRNIFLLFKKKVIEHNRVSFTFREPNYNFSFPDNDATWFLNPIDLKKFFIKNNCSIVCYQNLDHILEEKRKIVIIFSKIFPSFMGITRIIIKKNI